MVKHVALLAHDSRKHELLELVSAELEFFRNERLIATETTGQVVAGTADVQIDRVLSGAFGGDLQIGSLVATGRIKLVVFLRDPLTPHPHEPDLHVLLRVCDVHRVPIATNFASAFLCIEALRAKPRADLAAAVPG
jgi:methylglyoxal synthase